MKKSLMLILLVSLMVIFSVAIAYAAPPYKEPLDKVTFIHYKDGSIRVGGNAQTGSAPCYKLMGVKWASLPVSYVINPSNSGLSEKFVSSAISASAETWDVATSKELFNNVFAIDPSAKYGVADGKNAITFGLYSDNSKVIAVTSVWYSRFGKQIVEFDMLFNTYYHWGDATANSALMDLQNIATHELGHSVGLSDLYNKCNLVTMYGYSTEGETIKRDLEIGDITGLRSMYGN